MTYAELRKRYKIKRYKEVQTALENLEWDFKKLLGIDNYSIQDLKNKHSRQRAMEKLNYLIQMLALEYNPYDAKLEIKEEIKENENLKKWLSYYNIDIDFVTKDDIDILFKIMKKIAKRVLV